MTREELKKHCLKQVEDCEMWARFKREEPHGKIYEEYKLILELLEQKPKIGHWKLLKYINGHGHVYTCSECGETYFYVSNYCPNCGAKMTESGGENDEL